MITEILNIQIYQKKKVETFFVNKVYLFMYGWKYENKRITND